MKAQRICPLSDAAAAAWAQLTVDAFAGGAADPWTATDFAALSRSSTARLYAVGPVEAPLAMAAVQTVLDEAELLILATAPEAQRKGWARYIAQTALADLKSAAITHVFLEVAENNFPARALYKAMSFKKIGRRPGYYKPGGDLVDAIIMRVDFMS